MTAPRKPKKLTASERKASVARVNTAVLQVRLCDAVIGAFKSGLGESAIIEAFLAGWQSRSNRRIRIRVSP